MSWSSPRRLKVARSEQELEVSEGARLLWLKLQSEGLSQTKLAERLGVPSSYVARWLYCDRVPGRAWSHKIEQSLGIEARLWDEPPHEPFTLPAKITLPRTGS